MEGYFPGNGLEPLTSISLKDSNGNRSVNISFTMKKNTKVEYQAG